MCCSLKPSMWNTNLAKIIMKSTADNKFVNKCSSIMEAILGSDASASEQF